MADWDRELTEALQEGPRWPGDPDRLWRRIAARLPESPVRRPRPGWRWVAAGAAVAAALGLGLMGTRLRPGAVQPSGETGVPAVARGLRAETRVLDEPRAGSPLRFAVAVQGTLGPGVQVRSGALEVRTPLGDLVWAAPIPELSSRDLSGTALLQAEVVWPRAGAPGHYRAGVRLVTVDARGRVDEVGLGPAEIFIPFPAGAVRLGQVEVARPITQGPVTAQVERITLEPERTLVHFALTGQDLAGSFQWSLLTLAGSPRPHLGTDYRREEGRVVGVAAFEPVPAPVRALVVRLGRVGIAREGGEVTELPYTWEWEVPLGPAP